MAVLRNGDQLIFEADGKPVPAQLASLVIATPASQELAVRGLLPGEPRRPGFGFDVTRDEKIEGGIDETDVESKYGVRLVEAKSGKIVSPASDSRPEAPRYAVYTVARDGLPEALKPFAGKPVYGEGWQWRSGENGEELPWEIRSHLVETPVADAVVLRPLAPEEKARGGLHLDLNADGELSSGVWAMRASGAPTTDATVRGVKLQKELTRESVLEIHKELLYQIRIGRSFVADTSSDLPVWNYGITSARIEELGRDGHFAKYRATLTGGSKSWEYLIQEDAFGNPIAGHALTAPPDFLWQPVRAVAAPAYLAPGKSSVAWNTSALDRGYVRRTNDSFQPSSLAFYRYAADIVYASLQDTAQAQRYVMRDASGDLYFIADREAYERQVAALKPQGSTGAGVTPPNP
jgi:hypothetical protein